MISIEEYVALARKEVLQNQDCFVAQWILQNQEANLMDYTMCSQECWEGNVRYNKFWMERK